MKTKTMKTMKTMKILAYMFIAGLFTACSSGDDNIRLLLLFQHLIQERLLRMLLGHRITYTLDGRVMVTNGATLTIEAGTVIRCRRYWSRCIMFNNC